MPHLHPDKLIAVRRTFETKKKGKRGKGKFIRHENKPKRRRLIDRKQAAEEGSELIRNLAFQLGASRAKKARLPLSKEG